ncbi:MAG TPA: sigma-70 family RNA polymerase sigma factor [Acidimicrobiia bacterium]|nr:sigma-70 family RNA polymerase sigma factor [Acidimicrobiia bacterium]
MAFIPLETVAVLDGLDDAAVVGAVVAAGAVAAGAVEAGAVVPPDADVDLLLLEQAARASAAAPATASARRCRERMGNPPEVRGGQPRLRTGGPAGSMNRPVRGTVSSAVVEARPVLASDDGVRAVYAAHGPELYRFALRSLGDRGLAEEAVQEAFVRAWQAADRFDDALGSLRTWLFAIIRNVVIDLSRARAVRPALVTEVEAREPSSLDDDLERALLAWQVEEALHKLSDEHRNALVEVHFKGRAYYDVAATLGVPVGTVKSRVFYALKAMRLALEELGWSDDV